MNSIYLPVPVILSIGVVTFCMDLLTNPCIRHGQYKSVAVFPILFGHHILAALEKFGWLSNNLAFLKLMAFIYIGLLSTWAVTGGCPVTEYTNELCGPHHKEKLRDAFFFLGLKRWKHYSRFHGVYATLALTITLVKITLKGHVETKSKSSFKKREKRQ